MAPSPPPIRAALFDMDGLLIDSEDLYTQVTNEILHEYGKPDLPWNIKAKLQGRPGPEAGKIFFKWAQLPITPEEFQRKNAELQRQKFTGTSPLPGVMDLIPTLAATKHPRVHIALATSSHEGNFKIKSAHLPKLFDHFVQERRVLGDDKRIPAGKGKPAPDIYLLALKTINDGLRREGVEAEIKPEECLVFEDSVPGVESGRRAGMQVVWCPHPGLRKEYAGREKEVLAGLTGEMEEIAPKVTEGEQVGRKVTGGPGEIDDGWAVLVESLENFPYERFGINVEQTKI